MMIVKSHTEKPFMNGKGMSYNICRRECRLLMMLSLMKLNFVITIKD